MIISRKGPLNPSARLSWKKEHVLHREEGSVFEARAGRDLSRYERAPFAVFGEIGIGRRKNAVMSCGPTFAMREFRVCRRYVHPVAPEVSSRGHGGHGKRPRSDPDGVDDSMEQLFHAVAQMLDRLRKFRPP